MYASIIQGSNKVYKLTKNFISSISLKPIKIKVFFLSFFFIFNKTKMSAKVYVGNLSWNTTDDTLRQAFSDYGQVLDSIVMRDRDTGKSHFYSL